jgi:hypothetical protein
MSRLARLDFIAELTGQVNGHPIEVYGEGSIVTKIGLTSGAYRLRQMPPALDPRFLGGCLVTGYPSACASAPNTSNPFGSSDYSYTRDLDFADAGHLRLDVSCEYREGRLVSKFVLAGSLKAKDLEVIEPIEETWKPSRDHKAIEGRFVLSFRSANDQTSARCVATSTYRIRQAQHVPKELVRTIDLKASVIDGELLTLFQDSAIAPDPGARQ